MNFTSAIVVINFLVFGVAPHWTDAINLRAILNKRHATNADHASANDEQASAPAIDGDDRRELQSVGCWGGNQPSTAAWHPRYSMGWTEGYCRYTVDCNSPAYSSELACCKGAYAGQVSGACLRRLPTPPTSSPTGEGGGLGVYYPDYGTAWPDAKCINDAPMPSGRPTYSTMLACCKGAYGGQVSGKCLASLPLPPTTSPTRAGGLADFWYPDYDTPWAEAGCLNTLPLPYNNVNDRPSYSTQFACCKGAYGGQMSGICLRQLPSPPSTSPTLSGGQVDFWYPNYESPWDKAGCLNSLPLPYGPGDRPEYSSRVACCGGAYAGQASKQCMCEAVGVCFACGCGTAKERCENNCSNLDCQDDHEDGCATLLDNPTTAVTTPATTISTTTTTTSTTTTTTATTTTTTCDPIHRRTGPTLVTGVTYIGYGRCVMDDTLGLTVDNFFSFQRKAYDLLSFSGIPSGDDCYTKCSTVTNWNTGANKGVGMSYECTNSASTCACLFENDMVPPDDATTVGAGRDETRGGTGRPVAVVESILNPDGSQISLTSDACFSLPLNLGVYL